MRRFFARVDGGRALLNREDAHHLVFSLRAEVGEEIEIVDNGKVYAGRIVSLDPFEVSVDGESLPSRELSGRLTILFSPLKNGREEFVLQKGTELGVTRFVPYVSSRTVVRPSGESSKRKVERYRAIVKEASSQSRRDVVPEVSEIMDFDKAVSSLKGDRYFGDEELAIGGTFLDFADSLDAAYLTGPEGGIAPNERKLLLENGWKGVSLGRRILRSETSAVLAAALFMSKEEGR